MFLQYKFPNNFDKKFNLLKKCVKGEKIFIYPSEIFIQLLTFMLLIMYNIIDNAYLCPRADLFSKN